jgi:hypothetical protein
MFLRYTDLGVGHPATLRKLVRDCSSLESVTSPVEVEDMDVDSDDARTDGEGGGSKEDEDEQLESDEDEEEDFESEGEYDSDDIIERVGLGEEEVLDDDLDDTLSF